MTSDLSGRIQAALEKQLHRDGFEVELVPIPQHGDRMVRLRTLEEALEEFDQSGDYNMRGFLVQIRPSRKRDDDLTGDGPAILPSAAEKQPEPPRPSLEGIYLPNGKLNLPFLFKNAELLYQAGEYGLARNIFQSILQSGQRSDRALFWIGRCNESENRVVEAIRNYEESLTYHPAFDSYQRLAGLLMKQRKDQEAAELLERALSLKELTKTDRFETHKACGNCWNRKGQFEKSEQHYLKALELVPSADDLRTNLGVLCLEQGRTDEAKKFFQDALAANMKNDRALSGLGSCLMADGDFKGAHDYFGKALEHNIQSATAIYYLVKCAFEIRSYGTAERLVSTYVASAPFNANLLYSLAGLQYHQGKVEQTRGTLKKILEIQPQHAGANELMRTIERYAGT